MNQDTQKTAGIIIIGNEILSGKVHDINSFFLASELRKLGLSVTRISVIPDEVEIIGSEVSAFSGKHDYVFTSGGVGPTHDDVTMEGIAKGFAVKLMKNPILENFFHIRYSDTVNDAVMKMALVPEGAEVIGHEDMRFPLISFRNVFIFPGIPEYLQEKFSFIKERLRCSAFYLNRIFLNANESDIAGILNAVVEKYADVAFGSYPILKNPEYKIIITAESRTEETLNKAVSEFLSMISREVLVRAE